MELCNAHCGAVLGGGAVDGGRCRGCGAGGLCLLDYSFNSEAFSDLKVSEACARWIIPSIQNQGLLERLFGWL